MRRKATIELPKARALSRCSAAYQAWTTMRWLSAHNLQIPHQAPLARDFVCTCVIQATNCSRCSGILFRIDDIIFKGPFIACGVPFYPSTVSVPASMRGASFISDRYRFGLPRIVPDPRCHRRRCTLVAGSPRRSSPALQVLFATPPTAIAFPGCQSACNFDPRSASNFDPLEARRAVALAPSELVGVAETARARVVG